MANTTTDFSPYDPNRPIDASGPDFVFGQDQSATRTVNDGVTNSTTTVTSATAAFTVEDIGHTVSGTGIPYLAQIIRVNSATSVTLSLAATASASGVTLVIGGHYPNPKMVDTENVFGQGFILPPLQANIVGSTTGGTLAAATYFYVITAVGNGVNNAGETTKSNEKSVVNTGSTSSNTISWSNQGNTAAGGYKIYRSTTTGSEVFLTSVPAGTISFVDTGAITPGSATPPTANTALAYNPTYHVIGTIPDTTYYDGGYPLGKQEVSVNTRRVTDGATNTNKTVTSATAAFTSGDLGQSISGGTIPLNSYIVTVNSATSVTISAAATGTATGVTLTIGGYFSDGTGYAPGYPRVYSPAAPAYDGTVNGASAAFNVVPGDTTQTSGHVAAFGQSLTYGQSLVDGSVDQQFGAESNFPGTTGPGASGGVFTNQGAGKTGAATANPITGVPDTLGTSGGIAGSAGAPTPSSYSITGGDEVGSNAVTNGYPLFLTDGFDTPGSTGVRTTSGTNFNHVGVASNSGAITTTPLSYVLTPVDTLYGYTGLTAGSTGSNPTKPLSVSWVYGAGCAIVSWSPPSSTGGTPIREYIVVGYRVLDDTYIPLTLVAAAQFVNEPDVTWKDKGGTFLTAPVQANISGSTTGGTLAAGTRFYVVTALGISGETLASNEKTVVNTGSTSSNVISWAAVPGAVSYNVYRTAGASGSEVLLKNVAGVTYTDTNADTPGTAVPPSSPTAVTPTTSARVEHLEPGAHYFFRVYCRNDVGTSPMSDPVAGPSSPNNVPKYFMGLGMSGAVNTELDENALIAAEYAADRL